MSVALPVLCFVLVFAALRCWRPTDADDRVTFLSAALVWGVLLVTITEFLSLLNAVSLPPLAGCWAAAALVAGLLIASHVRRSRGLTHLASARPSLAVIAIALPIAAVVLGTGLIAVAGWPSQWDSMVYHLSRVDHWVQNRAVSFYPTSILRQLFNPPWAEFAILHLTVLSRDERWGNLVQWFSMLGSLVGVSLIAQRLGATLRGALFSALFCATLPMGILQASGTQNDYVAAFWLVCMTEALLSPPTTWRAFRVGAALGLATLTKGTSFVFAPPLLVALWFSTPVSRGTQIRQGAVVILIALALNVSHFARNLETFHSPLGPPRGSSMEANLFNERLSPTVLASNLVRNLSLHVGTRFVRLNSALERAIERGHAWFGLDVNDPQSTRLYPRPRFEIYRDPADPDRTGNPLHLGLIIGAGAAIAAHGRGRRTLLLSRYALALVVAFVLFCLVLKWQPWHSRLHLPLFVLASPLIALASDRFGKFALAFVAILMTMVAWPPLMLNRLAPLLGPSTVLNTSRVDLQFRMYSAYKLGYVGAAEFLRSHGCADVGLLLSWDEWEHPLWVLRADGRGRIEHVAVTNNSARLAGRRPPFAPCGIVAGVDTVAQTLDLDEHCYRLSWSSPVLKVFLPAECPASPPRSNISNSRAATTAWTIARKSWTPSLTVAGECSTCQPSMSMVGPFGPSVLDIDTLTAFSSPVSP